MANENNFNKNLLMFLTENREAALNSLYQSNTKYKKLCENLQAISERTKEIPVGYTGIIDSLTDALSSSTGRGELFISSGFKDCVKLYKRLDDTFDESGEFEDFVM